MTGNAPILQAIQRLRETMEKGQSNLDGAIASTKIQIEALNQTGQIELSDWRFDNFSFFSLKKKYKIYAFFCCERSLYVKNNVEI